MEEYGQRNGHRSKNRTKPKWTVMVYLAGDNNLTSNCITVLQQLEAVKYTDNIRVLACFDSNTPWPKGSRYLAINGKRNKVNNGLDWEIHNDLILPRDRDHDITVQPAFCGDEYDYSRKGSHMKRTGVGEGLRRFVNWAMTKQYPKSDHYMLVLYGHGPVVGSQTFLVRENPRSSLTLPELPKILGEHFGPDADGNSRPKLDILACQNCVMNGVETAYAVRDQVDYMIGSQGLVLTSGWPYDKIIGALQNPRATPKDITKKILQTCARHMIDFTVMDRSSEQSVCDLSTLGGEEDLTKAIRALGNELRSKLDFKEVGDQKILEYPAICDAIKLARLEAQSYWGEDFVDVYDFCERLLKKCNQAIVANDQLMSQLVAEGHLEQKPGRTDLVRNLKRIIGRCITVMKSVKAMVPYSYYIGPELQYSHGLSIYFPWSMPSEPYSFEEKGVEHVLIPAFETYSRYEFVRKARWAEFLWSFYRATVRKVRRAEREFELLDNNNLSDGTVGEDIQTQSFIVTLENLQKTGSDGGIVDHDVWSYVKNYPRRNYVSPSDCRRTIEKAGRFPAGSSKYPDPHSPPISYLGWNICEFLRKVIEKPSSSNGNVKRKSARPAKAPAGVPQPPRRAVRRQP
jgi:hypothetical protein